MDKTAFKPDTRYTLALRDAGGKARPANVYVYRVYDKFLIARATSGDGLVRKIGYDEVEKIVAEHAVAPEERYFLPAAVLDEKNWRDRTEMQVYASSPARGK
ncbi:MAG: hypothetical protein M0015_17710 [Betaproteobacteria bacterium]|nr:hypothetical protein [Betaproteobacteria bacterium]